MELIAHLVRRRVWIRVRVRVGRLRGVGRAHELVEKPLRQVRVLQAVDRQPPARVRVAVLQHRDLRVVHVLLLLA